jgi:hypothetical protein
VLAEAGATLSGMSGVTEPRGGILRVLADVPDPQQRLVLLCKAEGVTFREIEQTRGIAAGSISAYVSHHRYAFPKLKRLVSQHLAERIGEPVAEVAAFLFPADDRPIAKSETTYSGRRDRDIKETRFGERRRWCVTYSRASRCSPVIPSVPVVSVQSGSNTGARIDLSGST